MESFIALFTGELRLPVTCHVNLQIGPMTKGGATNAAYTGQHVLSAYFLVLPPDGDIQEHLGATLATARQGTYS